MIKKLLPIAAFVLLVANCTPDYFPVEDLSNKDQMNELVITDPLVWNSMVTQSMEIDTSGFGMKSGQGMNGEKEYPNKGYYFALFEDLYPSQGDYDFNDVVLQTKIVLDGKKGEVWGTVKTTMVNDGGTITSKIGLMFYSVEGNNEYTVIDNADIQINGVQLEGDEPFTMAIPEEGDYFEVPYHITDRTNNINQIWIAWFIIIQTDIDTQEIHTSGFPASPNRKFEIPQRDFLTLGNLPWGMEIEAEEFAVPLEKAFFLKAYPEFAEWAESEGTKNKDWYENPDTEYTK